LERKWTIEDGNGITLLLRVSYRHHCDTVQLLVQYGADVLAIHQDGRTAEGIVPNAEKNRQVEEFLENARRSVGSTI